MRYKTPVSNNLENIKVTLETTKRMLENKTIQSTDVIKNLSRVLNLLENSLDLIGRETDIR